MAPLKLFFQLPYNAVGWKAETELIRRFEIVCRRQSNLCFSSYSARNAMEVGADVIFTLHFLSAKVTPIFTAGLVWNPINFLRVSGPNAFVKTLSLDAHLYGGESIRSHFAEIKTSGYRVDDIGDFYPSAQHTEYEPIEKFGLPAYVGSLWQDDRHEALFHELNARGTIAGYGPGRRWASYKQIYRGSFPSDATSFQDIYRRTGIGLCLHSHEHLRENIPAMRIFEIVASGCVVICDRLPFVEQAFGDTVHYLDHSLSAPAMATQLDDVVARIHENPAQAREMARAAHEIFSRRFSLDVLLEQALQRIDDHRRKQRAPTSSVASASPIRVFTRTQGHRPLLLHRALRSLAAQTHQLIRSTLIYHGSQPKDFILNRLPELQAEFPQLSIDCIQVASSEPLSATIPAALQSAPTGPIAFLDDDDWVFPEHYKTLLSALEANPKAALAVSGIVMHSEYALNAGTITPVSSFSEDIGELLSFEPLDPAALKEGNFTLNSNMFLLRDGVRVDWTGWPQLQIGEDRALLALLLENDASETAFTSRVSCIWSNRQVQGDNQVDRVSEPDFVARTPLFTYKVPLPSRLRPPIISQSLHPWQSTGQKCVLINDLLRRNRWVPRWARPLFYQRKFDALLLTMVEDWIENRLLVLPPGIDIARLRRLSRMGLFSPHRVEFDDSIRQILASKAAKLKPTSGRHAINLETAHAFERFSKL